MKTISVLGYNCILQKLKYAEGDRIALQLVDAEDGCPVAMATVNITEESLEPDEVIIKDWSENEGILEDLMLAGIISKPIRIVPSGFVFGHVCKLLV